MNTKKKVPDNSEVHMPVQNFLFSRHPTGSRNFEVVPRFLVNLWTPDFTVDCTSLTP